MTESRKFLWLSAVFCVIGMMVTICQHSLLRTDTGPVTAETVTHAVGSLIGAGMLFTGIIMAVIIAASERKA